MRARHRKCASAPPGEQPAQSAVAPVEGRRSKTGGRSEARRGWSPSTSCCVCRFDRTVFDRARSTSGPTGDNPIGTSQRCVPPGFHVGSRGLHVGVCTK
eukprot:1549797-Prymnesium_polylepis.1